MDRQKRIRVVIVAAIGLLSLFVACIGAPLVAVALWPAPNMLGDADAFRDSFAQAAQTAKAANTVSLVSLLIAGGCVVYLLVALAGWFIGPPDRTPNHDA
jgi:hypothetical protein